MDHAAHSAGHAVDHAAHAAVHAVDHAAHSTAHAIEQAASYHPDAHLPKLKQQHSSGTALKTARLDDAFFAGASDHFSQESSSGKLPPTI